MAPDVDQLDIISNETYARNGYPHEAWAILRREVPVYWYERPGVVAVPFWTITKHEDIVYVSNYGVSAYRLLVKRMMRSDIRAVTMGEIPQHSRGH